VGAAGYNFAPDIITEIGDELRKLSRLHFATQIAELEDSLRGRAFNLKVVAETFLVTFAAFFVKMDQAIMGGQMKANDDNAVHAAKIKEFERRAELASLVYGFLPDIPSRSAVAFDIANDPNRIAQYIERIEQAYGEQQRQRIEKLKKLAEFFRHGSLDSVDLSSLINAVIQPSNVASLPVTGGVRPCHRVS
jgi:hypothetical protein